MKPEYLYLNFLIFILFTSCSGTKKDDGELAQKSLPDTIVYSIPKNYMEYLENLDESQKIEVKNDSDFYAVFEKYNYTQEAWKEGVREIPRLYVADITERWASKYAKEMSVNDKKRVFSRVVIPLLLRSNELILKDRSQLQEVIKNYTETKSFSENEMIWLKNWSNCTKFNLVKPAFSKTN